MCVFKCLWVNLKKLCVIRSPQRVQTTQVFIGVKRGLMHSESANHLSVYMSGSQRRLVVKAWRPGRYPISEGSRHQCWLGRALIIIISGCQRRLVVKVWRPGRYPISEGSKHLCWWGWALLPWKLPTNPYQQRKKREKEEASCVTTPPLWKLPTNPYNKERRERGQAVELHYPLFWQGTQDLRGLGPWERHLSAALRTGNRSSG